MEILSFKKDHISQIPDLTTMVISGLISLKRIMIKLNLRNNLRENLREKQSVNTGIVLTIK